MRFALGHFWQHRLAEANPHDRLWVIDLSACDQRACSPDTWCSLDLLRQALTLVRGILLHESNTPLCSPLLPDTLATISSRSIVSLIFASIRPLAQSRPSQPRSRLSSIRCTTTTSQMHVWPTHNALMRPSISNKPRFDQRCHQHRRYHVHYITQLPRPAGHRIASTIHPPQGFQSNGSHWRRRRVVRPINDAQILEWPWLPTATQRQPTDPDTIQF